MNLSQKIYKPISFLLHLELPKPGFTSTMFCTNWECQYYILIPTIIYKSPTGQDVVPCDVYLGDLTDELDGHYIVEFVSRIMAINGKMDSGITFNHNIFKILNF